jgi:ribokinase
VARVVVVGSANVDLVWHGARLPRPGETLTDGTYRRGFGGKGANQASAAAHLGADVAFVGMVGDDDHGREVRADLEQRDVDCTYLGTSAEPTGIAVILVGADGQNMIAVAPGANRTLTTAAVERAINALVGAGDAVLVSLEVGATAAAAALVAARAAGAITICNPAPFDATIAAAFSHCDVVVPNELEAEAFGGPAAMHAAGATTIVTTLGAHGARLHAAGDEPIDRPSCTVDVVDTTGAGDAFCAALAVALGDAEPRASAVSFACAAGALACTALGARAALPTRAQIAQLRARP